MANANNNFLPLQGVAVTVTNVNDPEDSDTIPTDAQGLATFTDRARATYRATVGAGSGGRCVISRGTYKFKNKHIIRDGVASWEHHSIRSYVIFRNQAGECVAGDTTKVTVKVYQGDVLKWTLPVDPQRLPDGSYKYEGPSMANQLQGSYTVKGTYTPGMGPPVTQQGNVTVPNDCGDTHQNRDGGTTLVTQCAHSIVQGPTFTFTVGY